MVYIWLCGGVNNALRLRPRDQFHHRYYWVLYHFYFYLSLIIGINFGHCQCEQTVYHHQNPHPFGADSKSSCRATKENIVFAFTTRCTLVRRGYREQVKLVVCWLDVKLRTYPWGLNITRDGFHLGLVCSHDLICKLALIMSPRHFLPWRILEFNGAAQRTVSFQKVFFLSIHVLRSSTLHAGTSSLVFVQESGGERSVTTADIIVNDMSVVQFDVSSCDLRKKFKWEIY